jgi:RHS repeat-associated protein
VTTYIYAASNLRHSKTTAGVTTTHIWDGSNISLDIVDGTATKYIRGIGLISSDDTFYLYNAHGDVVQLTDSSGVVTKSYDYDAFGVERDIDPNDTNPWRYCGEYWDVETGTVYLRARYYTPQLGRFTQEDPWWNTGNMTSSLFAIRESSNLYVYTMNNPVRFIDPLGLHSYILFDPHIHGINSGWATMRRMSLDLERHFGNGTIIYPVSDRDSFIAAFNEIGADGHPVDAVILHFHMGWNRIGFRDAKGTAQPQFNISRGHMDEITNTRNIPFLYFAGCSAALSGNGTNLTNEFARRSNINLVVGSDVSTQHWLTGPTSGNAYTGNYIRQSPSTDQLGFRVFWSGVGTPPRIASSFGSMGDLIREAEAARVARQ